jgi:tRNA modification GTPase
VSTRKSGLHTEVLKERMVDAVLQGQVQAENTIVTNARHYHALKEAEKSLDDLRNGMDSRLPGDLLAPDICRCLHYPGEITGEVSNEDMLDYIFAKFGIRK